MVILLISHIAFGKFYIQADILHIDCCNQTENQSHMFYFGFYQWIYFSKVIMSQI